MSRGEPNGAHSMRSDLFDIGIGQKHVPLLFTSKQGLMDVHPPKHGIKIGIDIFNGLV